jgi:hypothetical protein
MNFCVKNTGVIVFTLYIVVISFFNHINNLHYMTEILFTFVFFI